MPSNPGQFGKNGRKGLVKHNTTGSAPILRELLPDDERAVWDSAAVPVGASAVLDELFRRQQVIAYRFEKWMSEARGGKLGPKTKVLTASYLQDLMQAPIRLSGKLLEIAIRQQEADTGSVSGEALRAYLAQMSAEQLTHLLGTGELPRMDPSKGEVEDGEYELMEPNE